MTNNQNIDILTEIVNRNYENAQRKKRIQQKKAEAAKATAEIFAIANKPGIERRQREAAKRKQELEWQKIKDTFFHCLQLITFALLVADGIMLAAILIISWKWGIWG